MCLSVEIAQDWLERLGQYSIRFDDSSEFRSPTLTTLILRLEKEFDREDQASALAMEGLLFEIAVESVRLKSVREHHRWPSWLPEAKSYIDARYAHRLTLNGIGRSVGVHPVHVSRMFRKKYGCTVFEYIRQLRIERACSVMAAPESSLAQVAMEAGFFDQSHLTNTFRRLTGMTPAEYRTKSTAS